MISIYWRQQTNIQLERCQFEYKFFKFTLGAEIDMEVDVDDSELASDSAGEPTPVV